MKLEEINWPVFVLKDEKPVVKDSIIGYSSAMMNLDTNEVVESIEVVDDKNIPGNSLGMRRLNLVVKGASLFSLKKAIYMLGDLVRLVTGRKTWLIDSQGNLFNYIKSTRAPLTCHKIKKVLHATTAGYILEIEGINERFKLLNDTRKCMYVGIITYNRKRILYGLYEKMFKKTYRLI